MKKLKKLRLEKKISQARLAKLSSISRYKISEFECGYREPSKEDYSKMLAVLINENFKKGETIEE